MSYFFHIYRPPYGTAKVMFLLLLSVQRVGTFQFQIRCQFWCHFWWWGVPSGSKSSVSSGALSGGGGVPKKKIQKMFWPKFLFKNVFLNSFKQFFWGGRKKFSKFFLPKNSFWGFFFQFFFWPKNIFFWPKNIFFANFGGGIFFFEKKNWVFFNFFFFFFFCKKNWGGGYFFFLALEVEQEVNQLKIDPEESGWYASCGHAGGLSC